MDPRLNAIFDLLPAKCDSIFIAGGAAVDYDLASDVDLIFGGKNGFKNAQKFLQSFAFYRSYDGEAYESSVDLHLIGDAYDPMSCRIIQVIWTKAKTGPEVVDKFDISTHAAGWTSKGDPFYSSDFNRGTINIRFPYANHKTLGRYIKICKRYLQPVDLSILEKLSSKVEVKEGIPKIEDLPVLGPEVFKPNFKSIPLTTEETIKYWKKWLNDTKMGKVSFDIETK